MDRHGGKRSDDNAVFARLVVTDGPGRGRRYNVGSVATIGRAVGCEVLIDNEEVSRQHARLTRSADGYRIEDLGSSNGTLLNGELVQGVASVATGDRIGIADKIALVLAAYDREEDEIRQRQRLETVGRLGAGLAHDFNNMQSVITAGLDFILQLDPTRTLADDKLRGLLQDMARASERASGLARNLMSYAASDPEGYAIVDVSHVADEVLRFVSRTFARHITVGRDIAPNLHVIGSSAELHQVLMNLAVNARDAILDGGELSMRVELAESGSIAAMELPPGLQHVLITVADTGVGMDEETAARVFDPFFTTKAGATGFGLGLAMVKDVIAAHGGTISLDTHPGEGTTFRICLPAAPTAKKRRAVSLTGFPAVNPRVAEDSLVLIVDDEEMVRKTMGHILQDAGCRIVFARDGVEAVSAYAKQSRRPDVVVMDLDMPNASGESAIATLLDLDPDARILIVSAHHGGERERSAKSLGAAGFVAKPFSASTLVSATLDAMHAQLGIDEETALGSKPE